MERLINKINKGSYLDGSACHLDISQWATIKTWGKLNENQRKAIVGKRDMELIRQIITSNNYELLLLNGLTTSKTILEKYFMINDYSVVSLNSFPRAEGYFVEVDELLGIKLKHSIKIFGWNDYIQQNPSNVDKITNWINYVLLN